MRGENRAPPPPPRPGLGPGPGGSRASERKWGRGDSPPPRWFAAAQVGTVQSLLPGVGIQGPLWVCSSDGSASSCPVGPGLG
ncbi:hypothetical protein H8959_004105 [Pygathrix nigripes]